jgi:ABC-type multidrug transport system fused ATPase/permease subunit
MFVLNSWLALASLLVIPIMVWFTEFVARYTRKGFRALQFALGGLNGIAEESISGQKVIKAFRRNESVIEDFRKQNQAVFKAGVYANSYALLLMPLTNVLGNFFVIVLAGLGGCATWSVWGSSPPSLAMGRTLSRLCASWLTCTTRSRLHWPAPNGSLRSSTLPQRHPTSPILSPSKRSMAMCALKMSSLDTHQTPQSSRI